MASLIGMDPQDNIKRKIRDANFVFVFIASFLIVYFYTFALIEAKYSVFLHLQPFRTGRSLTIPETVLFALIFSLELLVLLWSISAILWRFYTMMTARGRCYAAWLIPMSVGFIYCFLITIQFQVLRYFKDGVSMMLIRELGGGDIGSAFHYVFNEVVQILPAVIAGIVVFATVVFLLKRLGSCVLHHLIAAKWSIPCFKLQYIILSNLMLLIIAFGVGFSLPVLEKNLRYSLAHHVYLAPWRTITDFDFDGYGLLPRPIDRAPFDSARHPYAPEILANGVDENGVGGDLEKNVWHQQSDKYWVADKLDRRNVLLIVLESARADLYQAKYQDQWVMPTLRGLPGQVLSLISHTAFSAPAITSIFNASYSSLESRLSLIDQFNALGYRTGVFSAQNEGFGKQDEAAGMKRAERFFDARSASPDKRMYVSSSAIALTIPAFEVLPSFKQWLQLDHLNPFFAYINLQELHFPYSYKHIPTPLIDKPIPRYSISEKESDWLRASYYNAARVVDSSIADIITMLKQEKLFDNTVIMVVGDHGEELFEGGSLGHGTNITYEQNSPIGKLINSPWSADDVPIGLSEIPKLIHNALAKKKQDRFPLEGSAIAFLGVRKPLQIGLFTKAGLIKYDFRKDTWSQQLEYGAMEMPAVPDMDLIYLWESYVLSLNKAQH